MKYLLHVALFVLFYFLITSSKCKKNSSEPELPPETTTGAFTFGCKINGQNFIPKDGRGRPGLIATYYNSGTNGWRLNIVAINWKDPTNVPSINIRTDSLLLQEGITYDLKLKRGSPSAEHDFSSNFFTLSSLDTGQLTITRHDLNQQILSGKFWFTATSLSGDKVQINEGRFDIVY